VVRLVQAGGSLALSGLIAQPYFLARSPGHVDENCGCLLSLVSVRIPLTISVSLMTDVSHVYAISSVLVPTAILVARSSWVCIPPIVLATW
jgi:hypothetical protein